MELILGDKAYSTWSLRPWLILKRCGAEFSEKIVRLNRDDTAEQIARVSPSGRVPALHVEGEVVWDSLSIAVWAGERFPDAPLWPSEAVARWHAWSTTCEMHSGFSALRNECAMGPTHLMFGDDRSPTPDSPAVAAEVRRLVQIWTEARARFGAGGAYLYGDWSVADAFFTPIAARIRHYQIDLASAGDADGVASAYVQTLLNQPDFLQWCEEAQADLNAG